MTKRVTRDDLAALWKSGAPLQEIADRFGCAAQTVGVWAKQFNLGPHPKSTRAGSQRVTEKDRQRMRELRQTGHDWSQIAKIFGRSKSTCYDAINRRGLPGRLDPADPALWVEVPQSQIIERRERLAAPHRDLTGALMGDPVSGYSALDRKR